MIRADWELQLVAPQNLTLVEKNLTFLDQKKT